MGETKKYPIGVQSFEKIIDDGYLYVDKTEYIYHLVKSNMYYFLSRPRRFGKSLFISTLEAFFLGKRELFRGLDIDRHDDLEWIKHPVFHLDFSGKDFSQDDLSLFNHIDSYLEKWEEEYGVTPKIKDVDTRFADVIMAAYKKTGLRAVVLVDEYDRPLLQNLKKEKQARQESFRNLLKGFFGVMKRCDNYIRFGFLTGVTKFGRVSVFSDLNNLSDITLLRNYNAICGITETELAENFQEGIAALGEQYELSYDETCAELKTRYDGYRFSGWKVEGIYNPFSLLSAFNNLEFNDYWFLTATPTMLIELLRGRNLPLSQLDGALRTEADLMGLEPMFKDPIPLLFQSGYLTIKGMRMDGGKKLYTLGFPNKEVESGFMDALLPYYVNTDDFDEGFNISSFIDALRENRVDDFMEMMKSLMAGVPYNESGDKVGDKVYENRLRDVVFIICRLMGMSVDAECHTNRGRIDMTVKTDRFIYIFEFKVDESPEKALEQIDEKHYADPYIADGRTVVKVGVEFSTEERNIRKWIPVEV